jgi:NADPH:quinone reductase-like Zn-dependent oxidoreductase
MTGNEKMVNFQVRPNQKDLVFMTELLEAGKVVPVIDRRYPLSEVAEAVRYYGEGHSHGKVVITM